MKQREYITCLCLLSIAVLCGCLAEESKTQATATTIATTTSTSTVPTSSTTTSTTATSTSTSASTTLFKVACSVNKDCGEAFDDLICDQGSVYANTITPICQSPNTPYAKCITINRISRSPVQVCPESKCQNGKCEHDE
ncbi:MAG: hypothetical protein V1744_01725 [Candidatus Altiarchaeota archaeon]